MLPAHPHLFLVNAVESIEYNVVTQQHIVNFASKNFHNSFKKRNLKIPMDKSGLSSSVPPKEKRKKSKNLTK